MPGGLLNIIAYGNQNIIIHGNPTKTFFKSTYLKHTNFGTQKFRLDYEGSTELDLNSDTTYKFKIPRHAELLLDTYLCLHLPNIWSPIYPPEYEDDIWKPYEFKWIHNIGTSIIKNVRIIIGSQIIQEYPGEYIKCIAERDFPEDKKKLFDLMIGEKNQLTEPQLYDIRTPDQYPNAYKSEDLDGQEPSIKECNLVIPLNEWFMNSSKLAFPLLCLQYSELTIEVELRPIKEIFTTNTLIRYSAEQSSSIDNNTKLENLTKRIQPNFTDEIYSMYRFLQPPPTITLEEDDYTDKTNTWNIDAHLIANYCFLSKEETLVLAEKEQKYLLKDVKSDVYHNIIGTKKIKLNTNALVSSWLWYLCRSDAYLRNEWSNYTNWETIFVPYKLLSGTTGLEYNPTWGNNLSINPGIEPDNIMTGYSITPVFSSTNTKYILKNFSIVIDGKYRENDLMPEILTYIEPYKASRVSNDCGLYNYNFCLNTTDYLQPSGAINLSRFKNIEFEITTIEPQIDPSYEFLTLCDENGDIIGVTKDESMYMYTYNMHLFEERYNVLRFMSGNAGLLFAR
tara:strand:- start:14419 stop:16110 length:1692 start_codon:yes stop_codon:yes gene_type:complete